MARNLVLKSARNRPDSYILIELRKTIDVGGMVVNVYSPSSSNSPSLSLPINPVGSQELTNNQIAATGGMTKSSAF